MAAFKVGDHVERIGSLVPIYMRHGVVLRVIPNNEGLEWATEYEVDFTYLKATFIQSQLRLVKAASAQDPH